MRISKIAIVALGAALIGACQAKSPEAAKDTNGENAAESIEPGTVEPTQASPSDTDVPTQASPSDSDVPAPKGQRRRR